MGSPVEVLDALTPTMFTTTAVLSLTIEIIPHLSELKESPYFETPQRVMESLLIVAALGVIAFVMIWVEF